MHTPLAQLLEKLGNLDLDAITIEHEESPEINSWIQALSEHDCLITKSLVFKPKHKAGQSELPVLVVTHNDQKFSSSSLAKFLNYKDMRVASPDVVAKVLETNVTSGTFDDFISVELLTFSNSYTTHSCGRF
jgi:prolyl-tRNA editing enzyme YbaK/EbsC (Cys-tRNA(Pro) deacylase)